MALALFTAALVGAAGYILSQDGKETRQPVAPHVPNVQRQDAAPHATTAALPRDGVLATSPFGAHPPPCFRDTCAGGGDMRPIDTRAAGGDLYSAYKSRNLEMLSGTGPGRSRENFLGAPADSPGFNNNPSSLFAPEMAVRAPPGVKSATPMMLHDRDAAIRGIQSTMKGQNTVGPPETQIQVPRSRDALPPTRLPFHTDLQMRSKEGGQVNPSRQRTKIANEIAFTFNRPRLRQEHPAPIRSGAAKVAGAGSARTARVPGGAVRGGPLVGTLQMRNTLRRIAATAPAGPAHNMHRLAEAGEQDKRIPEGTVTARAGVAHDARGTETLGGPQSTLIHPASRQVEAFDTLPGPASHARHMNDAAARHFTDTTVAGTMRECDGSAQRYIAGPHIAGPGEGAAREREAAFVAATLPTTMRACDRVGDTPGVVSGYRKGTLAGDQDDQALRMQVTGTPGVMSGPRRPDVMGQEDAHATRLSVAGRAEAGAAAVKKRQSEGSVQETVGRCVAEAPRKLDVNLGAAAPVTESTMFRGECVSNAPAPARATQRLPGDGLPTVYQQGRRELHTDRGFEGMAVGLQSLRGNPYTHRDIPPA